MLLPCVDFVHSDRDNVYPYVLSVRLFPWTLLLMISGIEQFLVIHSSICTSSGRTGGYLNDDLIKKRNHQYVGEI